jgi:hypothetical protein
VDDIFWPTYVGCIILRCSRCIPDTFPGTIVSHATLEVASTLATHKLVLGFSHCKRIFSVGQSVQCRAFIAYFLY